jgi:hypothetical protein
MGGDLSLGQDAGGRLVQQRLEQVMAGPVDNHHVEGRAPQRLGGEQTAKPSADDRHAMPATSCIRDSVQPAFGAAAFNRPRGLVCGSMLRRQVVRWTRPRNS